LKSVYGKKSLLSKESDTLKSYRVYISPIDIGIISSYSNRISLKPLNVTKRFKTIENGAKNQSSTYLKVSLRGAPYVCPLLQENKPSVFLKRMALNHSVLCLPTIRHNSIPAMLTDQFS